MSEERSGILIAVRHEADKKTIVLSDENPVLEFFINCPRATKEGSWKKGGFSE